MTRCHQISGRRLPKRDGQPGASQESGFLTCADDAIIVLNAGSSSLKFSIYAVIAEQRGLRARGQIEGIGATPHFRATDRDGRSIEDRTLGGSSPSKFGHSEAFRHLTEWMRAEFANGTRAVAVGHRIVHGGSEFTKPTLIDQGIISRLESLIPLAPLHQPHNLAVVTAVQQLHPELPQVACFDTSFHYRRARVTERFGLPDAFFHQGVRRWGFHGISYESIAEQFKQISPDTATGRVIVAHLGSGASLCAMRNGRSVETTMGFSVLDGLPMGTRCGSLDPGVILHLLREGWDLERIEELLYEKSGLLGISGVSNDVRDLLESKNPLAAEAIEYFVYRITREIGSLTAALGGLDALIFTAGIGENSPFIRERVCDGAAWLGIRVDRDANRKNERRISMSTRTPSVWVIPTDEEGVIAHQTHEIVRVIVRPTQAR